MQTAGRERLWRHGGAEHPQYLVCPGLVLVNVYPTEALIPSSIPQRIFFLSGVGEVEVGRGEREAVRSSVV